jgi:hypothetical protein
MFFSQHLLQTIVFSFPLWCINYYTIGWLLIIDLLIYQRKKTGVLWMSRRVIGGLLQPKMFWFRIFYFPKFKSKWKGDSYSFILILVWHQIIYPLIIYSWKLLWNYSYSLELIFVVQTKSNTQHRKLKR